MDHINLKLLMTTVILALELGSLKPIGYDSMWFDTNGISK